MIEEWRPVKGFEGRYEVSNMGRIKSMAREYSIFSSRIFSRTERLMILHDHANGYKVVWLRSPGVHKKYYVHRLVAGAFLIRPDDKNVVNHIDCDKHNNSVENLEWMTYSENTNYYYKQKAAEPRKEEVW